MAAPGSGPGQDPSEDELSERRVREAGVAAP